MFRRLADRPGVPQCPAGQLLAEPLQQFGIADDRRQRRAQLVGDVAHEVALEPLGLRQGGAAVGEGPLQAARVGDVGEGDEGRPVRQGPGLVGHDPAVRGADFASGGRPRGGVGVGHPSLHLAPESLVMQAGQAELDHAFEVHDLAQGLAGNVPEPLEGLVVQPQAPIRPEDRDGIVQLVEGGLLNLDQAVVLGLQAKLAGDVREEQDDAAEGVGLANHPEGAAVRQAPELVRGRVELAVALEFRRLPAGIVRRLRQAPALAQPVEDLAMGWPLGQPGRLEAEHLGEGGVVEVQSPGRGEDGDGVGDVVQGFVVGLDVPPQGLTQFLGLGDILCPDADPAALQGARSQPEGPPAATQAHPTHQVPALGQVGGFDGQGVGSRVQVEASFGRRFHVGGADGLEPGRVGPDRPSVGAGDPGRSAAGVEEGCEPGGGRQSPGPRRPSREAKPGQGPGGAALHRHDPRGPAHLKAAALAALEQGAEAQGVVGVGPHQGRHHSLGFRPGTQGDGAGGEALVSGGQEGATILDGQQGGVKGLGRSLGRLGAGLQGFDLPLQGRDPLVRAAPDTQCPDAGAQRQKDGAGCGGQDQAITGHGRDHSFTPGRGESFSHHRPKPDSGR